MGLPSPGRPSGVFRNPEGSVWCCRVGAQSGSKGIEAPGMSQKAALGEESSWEG